MEENTQVQEAPKAKENILISTVREKNNSVLSGMTPEEGNKFISDVIYKSLDAAKRQKLLEKGVIKIGRNDKCICGSEKKFKRCCWGSFYK